MVQLLVGLALAGRVRFEEHVFEVICSGHVELFDYVMAWMAQAVQHRPVEVALALRGPRGAGKGVCARTFGGLFGQHYMQIANAKHLTGNFNAHLQDAIVLFADEAFWAGDKAAESVLKMLITEPLIPIERKGRDVVVTRNVLHLIMASNSEWIVPAGMDERRFCVIDVAADVAQDTKYFDELQAEIDDGGRSALLHALLQHDVQKVNLRRPRQQRHFTNRNCGH